MSETFTAAATVQTYTVPMTATYAITAIGGNGGGDYGITYGDGLNGGWHGGLGAEVVADFTLNAGDVIEVIAGQNGSPGADAGGGGGGSFVYDETTDTVLEVAGGGGGAGITAFGGAGQAGTAGAAGTENGGAGGTDGTGGDGASGGGGGGYLTMGGDGAGFDGTLGEVSGAGGGGGSSFTAGGAAGIGSSDGGSGGFAVERLAIGDRVKTLHAGIRQIKWIGQRRYAAPFANHPKVLPIRIKAGAIADRVPARDLFVSPGHAICIDGVLTHASNLVNGRSIVQVETIESVAYFHIELDSHEVIFAENCPAETFRGESFRLQFQNAAEYFALYPGVGAPEHACLPVVQSGFLLQAIRERLAARAGIVTPAQVPGRLTGYIDGVGDRVTGWAQDVAQPEQPVCLDVLVDGQVVARALANGYRGDLKQAGLGSGRHAFDVRLSAAKTGWVEVRRSTDGAALPRTDGLNAAASPLARSLAA
jgi:hypothetical protein